MTGRFTDSLIVIDRGTGKVLRRWGNAAYLEKHTGRIEYRSGPPVLGGPHDVREIPAGLPGAGHLTCCDNGTYLGASRVVEIDPATWGLVWQYPQEGIGRKHYSDFAARAQRLAGGNTLVCDGANGRLFQVTRRCDVVWEFVSPYIPSPRYKGAVLKCYFYARDHCGRFKELPRD